MKETEITVQVMDSYENVINTLLDKGFQIIEEYNMTDWYFSKYSIEELKAMEYIDIIKNSMLVREINDEHPRVSLVYKSKELDDKGNVVSEEKISTGITSRECAMRVLNLAGLNNWCVVDNSTTVMGLDNLVFQVQNIAGLGAFIEYEEDESVEGDTPNEKFDYMCKKLQLLNLPIGDDFSCKKVYMKFLKENEK